MTVITYRNGAMCCDSCWTYGNTQTVSHIKIKRLSSGALLGGSGDNDGRAIEALLDKVKKPSQLPSREALTATKDSGMFLLAIPRQGVWVLSCGKVDEQGYATDDDEDYGVWPGATMGGYAAIGSGADVALGAMDAGASAYRAVEIACRRDINCRLPVHQIALVPHSRTPARRHK